LLFCTPKGSGYSLSLFFPHKTQTTQTQTQSQVWTLSFKFIKGYGSFSLFCEGEKMNGEKEKRDEKGEKSGEKGKRDEKGEKRSDKSKESNGKSLLPAQDVSFLLPLLPCPIGLGEEISPFDDDDDEDSNGESFSPSTPPLSPTRLSFLLLTPPLLSSTLSLPPETPPLTLPKPATIHPPLSPQQEMLLKEKFVGCVQSCTNRLVQIGVVELDRIAHDIHQMLKPIADAPKKYTSKVNSVVFKYFIIPHLIECGGVLTHKKTSVVHSIEFTDSESFASVFQSLGQLGVFNPMERTWPNGTQKFIVVSAKFST